MQFPIGYYIDESSPRAGLRHEHDALSRDDVAADHTRAIQVPKQSPDATVHSSHHTALALCCYWHAGRLVTGCSHTLEVQHGGSQTVSLAV